MSERGSWLLASAIRVRAREAIERRPGLKRARVLVPAMLYLMPAPLLSMPLDV